MPKEPKYYLLQNQRTGQWAAYRVRRFLPDLPLELDSGVTTWLGDPRNKEKWLEAIRLDKWMQHGRFIEDQFIREDV